MFSFFKKERSAAHEETPEMAACYSEESARMEASIYFHLIKNKPIFTSSPIESGAANWNYQT